jgi:hypothetical protein
MSPATGRPPGWGGSGEVGAVAAFLAMLVGRERDGLLEVRVRLARGGMSQRFYPADRLRGAADELLALGARTDVYVGCAPRRRRSGGRAALGRVWTLWADCDDDVSVARLAAFAPAPAVVVRSGIIRSERLRSGCSCGSCCRRHVISGADRMSLGGDRDGR